MKTSSASAKDRVSKERGSALLVVIWGVGVLTALGALIAADTHLDTLEASAARENFLARTLAENGLRLGSAAWSASDPALATGQPLACRTSAGALAIEVRPANALVNINLASEGLLAGLFEALGTGANEARSLAAAVADYRDADTTERIGGGESATYQRLGLPGPANRPFLRPAELSSVAGITDDLFQAALPHITTFSTSPGLDTGLADPVVVRAAHLAHGFREAATPPDRHPASPRPSEPSPTPEHGPAGSIFVRSEAFTRSGYRAVAEATYSARSSGEVFDRLETFRWATISGGTLTEAALSDLPDCE